jgi:hypothetical protein
MLRVQLNATATTLIGIRSTNAGGDSDVLAAFARLCTVTGGVDVVADALPMMETPFDEAMQLLRGRYVLEFPRPAWLRPGIHRIAVVGSAGPHVTLYPAGLSFPAHRTQP